MENEKKLPDETKTVVKQPKPRKPREHKVKSCDDNHTIGMMRVFGRL